MDMGPANDTSNHESYCKTLSEPSFSFPNLPLIACVCTAAESKENRTPTWDLPLPVTVMKSYLLNCFQNTGRGSTLAVSC